MRQEEFFNNQKTIMDSLSVGIVAVNLASQVIYINQKALELTNFPENPQIDTLIGKSIEEFFIHIPQLIQKFQSDEETISEIEVNKNNYLEFRIKNLHDNLHNQIGRVAELFDISQRKLSEEQMLLQSYALEAAASGIMITDSNGIIQWVNQSFSEITGFSKEYALGKSPNIQKSGLQTDTFYMHMWDSLNAGRSWRGEMINRRMDGSLYTEEQTIAPVKKPNGEIGYYISVKHDVSERKALEKLRDDLVHTIVHDLRNPLTSITMSLDLIEKVFVGRLEARAEIDILEIARSNTRRMATLVNTILDINRLENERIPAKFSVVQLNKLASDAMKFQVSLAHGKGLELINGVPVDLPFVVVDIALIGRVFQNLIDNAIKFTPENGIVLIGTEFAPQPNWIKVFVQDSGPGLPHEVQRKLFQKFSAEGPGHGTGLGLAYCRLAIEAHGGQIWAETSSNGTRFIFTLPLAEQ